MSIPVRRLLFLSAVSPLLGGALAVLGRRELAESMSPEVIGADSSGGHGGGMGGGVGNEMEAHAGSQGCLPRPGGLLPNVFTNQSFEGWSSSDSRGEGGTSKRGQSSSSSGSGSWDPSGVHRPPTVNKVGELPRPPLSLEEVRRATTTSDALDQTTSCSWTADQMAAAAKGLSFLDRVAEHRRRAATWALLHRLATRQGREQYVDPATGCLVFTTTRLKKIACCKLGCRHCPHGGNNDAEKKAQLDW